MHLDKPILQPPDLLYWYTIAGIKIRTNHPIEELQKGWFDDCISLYFTDMKQFLRDNGLSNEDLFKLRHWSVLPNFETTPAIIRDEGTEIIAFEIENKKTTYTLETRRIVPFASGILGKVILHGAGIHLAGRAFAFIGESGVGKSTIASNLSMLGYHVVSDDLLPCRERGNKIVIPDIKRNQAENVTAPLKRIYFLGRDNGLSLPHCSRISRKECLLEIIANGFGELASHRLWTNQFLIYRKIASQVDAFRLTFPDDQRKISDSVKFVIETIFESKPK